MGNENVHIEGTVKRIIFENSKNGYVILEIETDEDIITVCGNLGKVDEGDDLSLDGYFEVKDVYGLQFRAEYCEKKLPTTTVDIEKFLLSGAIKSITKTLVKKIIREFGENTLEIIEKSPERLMEVKGITQKKCDQITEDSRKLFLMKKVTAFLAEYKIRNIYAMRFYYKYGTDSLDLIKENPYILCEKGIDLKFENADTIAYSLGMPGNAVPRVIAGMKHILSNSASDGHTCMPSELLWRSTGKFLRIAQNDFITAYKKAIEKAELFSYIKNGTEYVYLPDYYESEVYISEQLLRLCGLSDKKTEDVEKLIDNEEATSGKKYEKEQRKAITMAISEKVMVLTGTPGTGKTTAIKAIISILINKKEKVYLAAPTGRAAKRMSELTGYEAKTIHRLLEMEYNDDSELVFQHNEDNPLQCDTIVIDEASMVDSILFQRLLEALKPECRLIIVGDFHQLPSVGAGNVLQDIIDSGVLPVVELKEIFRQSKKSSIITNAHEIVSGRYPDLTRKDSDFFFFGIIKYDVAANFIVDLAKRRLPNSYGFSPFDDIQIISPSKNGTVGIKSLNIRLQNELNPHDDSKEEYSTEKITFRTGDKVMQTQNNYEIAWKKGNFESSGIFNGDIGRIISIDNTNRVAEIDFDGRIAEYSFNLLYQLTLAYAITVHKSQGCEFDAVIMPVMDGFDKLCYRSLLYTAITRAKKLLILVGSQDIVCRMVDNNSTTERYTCLMDMLKRKDNENG